jgi:hypothetical protein
MIDREQEKPKAAVKELSDQPESEEELPYRIELRHVTGAVERILARATQRAAGPRHFHGRTARKSRTPHHLEQRLEDNGGLGG